MPFHKINHISMKSVFCMEKNGRDNVLHTLVSCLLFCLKLSLHFKMKAMYSYVTRIWEFA